MPRALSRQQQQRLVELVEYWLHQAERHWELRYQPVEIRFDLRGRAAGQYRSHPKPCIRFNAVLAASQFEAFCEQTPGHEVAHHVVEQLYPDKRVRPHGREWQAVMHSFGLDPRRCHEFDLSNVPQRLQRRFPYRCGCREHQLSATRHNRILRGEANYYCRQCGESLRAVE